MLIAVVTVIIFFFIFQFADLDHSSWDSSAKQNILSLMVKVFWFLLFPIILINVFSIWTSFFQAQYTADNCSNTISEQLIENSKSYIKTWQMTYLNDSLQDSSCKNLLWDEKNETIIYNALAFDNIKSLTPEKFVEKDYSIDYLSEFDEWLLQSLWLPLEKIREENMNKSEIISFLISKLNKKAWIDSVSNWKELSPEVLLAYNQQYEWINKVILSLLVKTNYFNSAPSSIYFFVQALYFILKVGILIISLFIFKFLLNYIIKNIINIRLINKYSKFYDVLFKIKFIRKFYWIWHTDLDYDLYKTFQWIFKNKEIKFIENDGTKLKDKFFSIIWNDDKKLISWKVSSEYIQDFTFDDLYNDVTLEIKWFKNIEIPLYLKYMMTDKLMNTLTLKKDLRKIDEKFRISNEKKQKVNEENKIKLDLMKNLQGWTLELPADLKDSLVKSKELDELTSEYDKMNEKSKLLLNNFK